MPNIHIPSNKIYFNIYSALPLHREDRNKIKLSELLMADVLTGEKVFLFMSLMSVQVIWDVLFTSDNNWGSTNFP